MGAFWVIEATPIRIFGQQGAYMKILESSQTLLHVLKRETVNLTKCGHRDGSVGARQYLDVRLEVNKRSVGGLFAPIYPGL